ncbi:MAG: SdrD B-like domain-containing protein [Vicingaceae bacterium]
MKRVYILITSIFIAFGTMAQTESDESFRASMVEGSRLMEEFNYSVALDIWMKLLEQEPHNANVNFKAGVCLWKLPKRRNESLPYFKKAVKNVTERFDPYAPNEEGAPVEAYFYIGEAYHLNYDLDSAIAYFNRFKNQITHNHEFWSRTSLNIEQCETAKKMILEPIDIEVINLGSMVNSPYPDYAPALSLDESELYFTSQRLRADSSNLYAKNPDNGNYYDDIYVSFKGEDNAWGEPKMLDFNTSDNEATLSLSADGETMFIYKSANNGNGDIYSSKLSGGAWSDPKPLGSDINSTEHETHAAVSPDGTKLYFVSNREGSLNFPDKAHQKVRSQDIYFCNILPTGDWALAQPLTELNTPYNEDGIFLHPDGKSLFFSSEGHGSMGGYDIYTCELDDEGNWGKPENIGYPLNTTGDDVFFVTSASGKRGYYSSVRDDGFGAEDLYAISMLSFKAKPLTLLIGQLKTSDGSALPDGILIYVTNNETGEPVGTYKPRARDSKFTMIIPPGSDYHIDYTYRDSVFYQDDIFVPENSVYQEIKKGIALGAVKFSDFKEDPKKQEQTASATHGSKNPNVEGKLKYGAAGAAGVNLKLKDSQEKTIGSTTTDGSGNFEFKNLKAGSMYYIMIDANTGEVPENAQLFIRDQETGTMLPVSKMANGSFKFETLPYMSAEELAKMEEVDDTDERPMPVVEEKKKLPPAYKTQVKQVDGKNYIIHEVKEGETFFSISVLYNLKFEYISASNPTVGDLIHEGEEILVPIPPEVMFYFEFFDYNVMEINQENEEYKNFLVQVEKVVQESGSAKLMVEASASKVPSTAFGGNNNLTEKRAEMAKSVLTASMQAKGISADKLNFVSISTLVRGPEFQNDAAENRETYKNYQYVKIIVK